MMSRNALLAIIVMCIGCQSDAPTPAAKKSSSGPTMKATVVTIRTTMKPEELTRTQTLVIAGDRARDTSEQDTWRLFDTKANTVTFVDDVAKTYRTESMQSLIAQRRAITNGSLPPYYPRVRLTRNGTKVAIESGAYKRELSFTEHPQIPRGLFAMMYASDAPTQPLAPMMREVDEALIAMRGFPQSDHAEVPVAKDKLIVDRQVVSVAQKDVPEAIMAIPKGFRDLTPKAKQ